MLVADRYLLVEKVGAGGMGTVWAAHDQALDAPCAVKLVHEHLLSNEEVRARFAREAKLAAQLRSAHVVHVFDCGEASGTLYIVMEWLEGESLAERLDREERLDTLSTYRIVAHVARALTTAHALGIVHRDLKPDNVFLVPGYDEETAKVLDFGIAHDTEYAQRDHLTIPGTLLGTPVYLSPEQARGKPVDHRADLWSLGVIVFECLTGASPFDAPAIGEIMGRILYEPLPRPTDFNAELPPAIDDWWLRAMARDKAERFQSAKDFADSLAEALGVEHSVSVAPPGRSRASSLPGLTRASGIHLPRGGERRSSPPSTPAGKATETPAARGADGTDPARTPSETATSDTPPPESERTSDSAESIEQSPVSLAPSPEPEAASEESPPVSPVEAHLDASVIAANRSGTAEADEGPVGGAAQWLALTRAHLSRRFVAVLAVSMFLAGVLVYLIARATSPDEPPAPPEGQATSAVATPARQPAEPPVRVEPQLRPSDEIPTVGLESLPQVPSAAPVPTVGPPSGGPATRPRHTPAAAPAPSVRDYGI